MSIITLPATIYFGAFALTQRRFDIKEQSDTTGDARERLLAPPRWACRMAPPQGITYEHAAEWKTMLLRLRGGINHLAVYDIAQPRPRGTLSGAVTLAAQASAGATTASVQGAGGSTTLKAGDWLQIGSGLASQLVAVVADVTMSGGGTGTVTFEPPLRATYAASTVVTWDKPVAHYKMVSDVPEWAYVPGAFLQTGFSIDLLEQWS